MKSTSATVGTCKNSMCTLTPTPDLVVTSFLLGSWNDSNGHSSEELITKSVGANV